MIREDALLIPDWPAPESVSAFVTTRLGGRSKAPWDELNLATHVGDFASDVHHNRKLLHEYLGEDLHFHWLNQVHGSTVVEAKDNKATLRADASFSRDPRQVCMILTADCLPVFFCNKAASQVAVCHAGWRGLGTGVLENTLEVFNDPAEEIIVWLGPAIGPDYFEVGDDVVCFFMRHYPNLRYSAIFSPVVEVTGKWLMNIYEAATQILLASGVVSVFGGGLCTYADKHRFYSYRRDGVCGRMASCIWLSN